MTPQQREYVERLETEVCRLKERVALLAPKGEPKSGDGDAYVNLEVLNFLLEPTSNPDIFIWRCALPVGGVSLALSRKEAIRLCTDVSRKQLGMLRQLGTQ